MMLIEPGGMFFDARSEGSRCLSDRKYSVNPWSTVEVAIRALPQERFAFCRVSIAGRIALPLRSAMSEL